MKSNKDKFLRRLRQIRGYWTSNVEERSLRHLDRSATVCLSVSGLGISLLVVQPVASFYAESTFIGQFLFFATILIVGFIVGGFFKRDYENYRAKRYIILFKIISLPFSVGCFFLAKAIVPNFEEALFDRSSK